jgi:hypothetical protein
MQTVRQASSSWHEEEETTRRSRSVQESVGPDSCSSARKLQPGSASMTKELLGLVACSDYQHTPHVNNQTNNFQKLADGGMS